MSGKRGEAGAKALDTYREQNERENKKKLKKSLERYRREKIPLIKKDFSKEVGLSVSTLNREPYKTIMDAYLDEEKVFLSPNAKQEVAELVRENRRLREELDILREQYNRLKKEITYIKELFH